MDKTIAECKDTLISLCNQLDTVGVAIEAVSPRMLGEVIGACIVAREQLYAVSEMLTQAVTIGRWLPPG